MRQIGQIKWFGGFNAKLEKENDFGFITPVRGGEDIYVHRKGLLCAQRYVYEGTWVTFELVSRGQKQVAQQVKLLMDEEDLEILEAAMAIEAARGVVFEQYIQRVVTPENVQAIEATIRPHNHHDRCRVERLSDQILSRSQLLIKDISPKKRVELATQMEVAHYSLEELKQDLKAIRNSDSELWEDKATNEGLFDHFKEQLLELVECVHGHFWEKAVAVMNEEDCEKALRERIGQALQMIGDRDLWNMVENKNLDNQVVYDAAPNWKKLRYIGEGVPFDRARFLELLGLVKSEEKDLAIYHIKDLGAGDQELFAKATDKIQAAIFDEKVSHWNWLSNKGKIYYLYRVAWEALRDKASMVLPEFILENETHPFIRVLAQMMLPQGDLDKATFEQLDYRLNRMITVSFENKETLDLYPLLPDCPLHKVKYCEGRIWYKDHERTNPNYKDRECESIWCPRGRGTCMHIGRYEEGILGYSHCYPRRGILWTQWTLTEYMKVCGIEANLPRLDYKEAYINRIAGWANRLEELLEIAKCSHCGKTMKAHEGYAKRFDAVFNATVFNCRETIGVQDEEVLSKHDTDVYLSYCWACQKIIDSRVTRVKKHGMYLCRHCGNGPRDQRMRFKAGDVCPNCGEGPMKQHPIYNGKMFCESCKHTIQIVSLPKGY